MYFPIKNHEEYFINKKGDVASTKSNRVLKQQANSNGYMTVNLSGKTYRVHRLMAETFINNNYGLPMVDHIDGDKQNNSIDNLRWCTHQENCDWACDERMLKSDSTPKKIMLDDMLFETIYAAAKHLCDLHGKRMDTVRRELRRKTRGSIYGHKITRV